MLNQDIDVLIKRLKIVRLQRAETLSRLDEINKSETVLLKNIQEAKEASLPTKTKSNPFVVGDVLRITNRLRDEFGIVGEV